MSKAYVIHMFNKHVSEITSMLEQIASNCYTHILISPVNMCNKGPEWWCRYHPMSYQIGSSEIVSYDEIKQFIKKVQ